MKRFLTLTAMTVCISAGLITVAQASENLCFNGSFDNTNSWHEGWTIDYDWDGNHFHAHNADHVSLVERDGLKRKVLCLQGSEKMVDSRPVPFEKNGRYRVTLDVRADAGSARMYLCGWKWQPGVHPYANPHLGDLRLIWKGKPAGKIRKSWSRVSAELPYKKVSELSSLGRKNFAYIRFITLRVVLPTPSQGPVYIDNVKIEKIN